MRLEQLEIIRIAEDGSSVRRILCVASRVNVLRSQSEDTLSLYERVLRGQEQNERFTVLLDDRSFLPQEHHFIGFGESLGAVALQTVRQLLEGANISSEEIEPLLFRHGLGGCGNNTCGSLDLPQQKVVRSLVAMKSGSSVLVVREPFSGLLPKWKEHFAESLIDYARKESAIVIIPRLTERPDCWLDNPYVARLQIEQPRRKTIGFSAVAPLDAPEAPPAQVQEINLPSSLPSSASVPSQLARKTRLTELEPLPPQKQKSNPRLVAVMATALLLILSIAFPIRYNTGQSAIKAPPTPDSEPAKQADKLPERKPAAVGLAPQVQGLAAYPPELKAAIVSAAEQLP